MSETPARPIVIRCADGSSFTFDPDEDLWRDMLAYCATRGWTLETLIQAAAEDFFRATTQEPAPR
jgi:hypothetical protein